MSVPLLHLVGGRAGNVVPVKIYASVSGGAAEICGNYERRACDCGYGAAPGGVDTAYLASDVVDVFYAVF